MVQNKKKMKQESWSSEVSKRPSRKSWNFGVWTKIKPSNTSLLLLEKNNRNLTFCVSVISCCLFVCCLFLGVETRVFGSCFLGHFHSSKVFKSMSVSFCEDERKKKTREAEEKEEEEADKRMTDETKRNSSSCNTHSNFERTEEEKRGAQKTFSPVQSSCPYCN